MRCNYLLQRGGRYYFRIRIPKNLRRWFDGRVELKRSLNTIRSESTRSLLRPWVYRTEQLFFQIRSGMLTDDQIQKLVASYLEQSLGEDEEARIDGVGLQVEYGEDGEHGFTSLQEQELRLESLVESLARGEYEGVTHLANGILEGASIQLDKNSSEYRKLCRETLKAVIEGTKVSIERTSGNYDNWFDRRTHPAVIQPQSLSAPTMLTSPQGKQGTLLSAAIAEYVTEHSGGGHWTPKTKVESEGIYALLVGIVGDRDIAELDYKTLASFRDTLTRFPSNVSKKKEFRGRSIPEILKMEITEPLSVSSVNKYIIRVGAFLKWAVKRGYVVANYAEGLTIAKRNTKEEEEREAYYPEDLLRLIESPLYASGDGIKDHPERYWIPLIGLFSGMRLNEICQLHLEDIREEGGLLCFDINKKGDKELKTASSRRLIPVHPVLLELGFKEYVDALRKKEESRLWPALKKKRDGYGMDFGKWFGRFNRIYVTDNPKRSFHSLRHTLADNLKQKKVDGLIIAEILGHSHGSITLGRYGKSYEPRVLIEALTMLDYGVSDALARVPRWEP
jgi:integrase